MRLSCNDNSPYWSPLVLSVQEVRIDGVPTQHVYEADDEEGWAVVSVLDEDNVVVGARIIHGSVEFIYDTPDPW